MSSGDILVDSGIIKLTTGHHQISQQSQKQLAIIK